MPAFSLLSPEPEPGEAAAESRGQCVQTSAPWRWPEPESRSWLLSRSDHGPLETSQHKWIIQSMLDSDRQDIPICQSILTCTSYRDSAIVRWKLCDAWLKSKEFHFISGRLKSLGLRLHWDCRYNAIHCKLRTTKIVKILVFSFVRAVKTFAYVIYILACLFRNLHIIDKWNIHTNNFSIIWIFVVRKFLLSTQRLKILKQASNLTRAVTLTILFWEIAMSAQCSDGKVIVVVLVYIYNDCRSWKHQTLSFILWSLTVVADELWDMDVTTLWYFCMWYYCLER